MLGAGLEALTGVISVPKSEGLRSRGAGDGQRMQAAGPASGQETHLALSLQLDAQTEEQRRAHRQRLRAPVPTSPDFCPPCRPASLVVFPPEETCVLFIALTLYFEVCPFPGGGRGMPPRDTDSCFSTFWSWDWLLSPGGALP